MREFTIADAAIGYRNLWEGHERVLYEKFTRSPEPADLRRAMRGFGIARNFIGIGKDKDPDEHKARYVLNQILISGSNDVISSVTRLAAAFEAEFGRRNVSAASKLLWLRHRSPYVIYDNLAKSTLKKLGHRINGGDFSAYFSAWHAERRKLESEIVRAVDAIPSLSNGYNKSESWFADRVFDNYLWAVGKQNIANG